MGHRLDHALNALGVPRRSESSDAPKALIDRSSFDGGYPFDAGDAGEMLIQTLFGYQHNIEPRFLSFVQNAYRESPVMFGLIAQRMHLFSEPRFQWRERINGRPGDYFGTPALAIIEKPWPNGHTRDLLKIAEIHNACAGNFFAARRGDQLRVMRPDWTDLVIGTQAAFDRGGDLDPWSLDAELLGYAYWPGGYGRAENPVILFPNEVMHYMPTPDPVVPWRGSSWLGPIVDELCSDREMTAHKRAYLKGGATPNVAMVLDPEKLNIKSPDEFDEWVTKFEELRQTKSGGNPYRMMFTIGGADPKVLGANLDQIDFKNVQAAGEVRMATAAMVHPSIVAIQAGLEGSALNAGNFEAAFRQFANGTMRPLWGSMAAAIEPILNKPTNRDGSPRDNVELVADDRDVPALQEDAKKAAEVYLLKTQAIQTAWNSGFTGKSAVAAAEALDVTLLDHTGLSPVQAQPAGESPDENAATSNGSGPADRVAAP